MSARSIRRAAERFALKAAAKPIVQNAAISDAQLAANRANAQFSSGPRTGQGKAMSSLNAVKTGLTGRTVVLPSDDAADYQRHILAYEHDFNPVGAQECDLVQSIADCVWRLRRITCIEQALFSKGHLEFFATFADTDPAERAALIELHTYQTYEKTFRNLQLQESRLARRREKEIAELRRLQQERLQKEQEALKEAAALYLAAKKEGKSWITEENGFEFSAVVIERFLATQKEPPTTKPLVAAA